MHASLADTVQQTLPACRQPGRNTRARMVSHAGAKGFPRGHFTPSSAWKQRGTALIFALVMLLMLTILAITAITTSSLQEKMAGNMRDQYMAQQAGDSILRDAEALIFNQISKPTPACPPLTSLTERIWDSASAGAGCLTNVSSGTDAWWTANGFASTLNNNKTAREPRYVVEYIQRAKICLSCSPPVYRYYYRTTGWSVGFTDSARALLQSVFTKKSDDYL